MCKKSLLTMCVGLLAFTAIADATVTTFGTGGLAGWTQVSSGVAITADTSPAWGVAVPISSVMTLTTPVGSNLINPAWEVDVAQIQMTGATIANADAGAYVGFHYAAPSGQMIESVVIPKIGFATGVGMTVQITDAAGVVVAQVARKDIVELRNLSAAGLNTSAIDIRFTNTTGSVWGTGVGMWNTNGVAMDQVIVTTIPEPATMGLLGFGVLGLLRRKHA